MTHTFQHDFRPEAEGNIVKRKPEPSFPAEPKKAKQAKIGKQRRKYRKTKEAQATVDKGATINDDDILDLLTKIL